MREHWSTRFAFIMAAAGSAVGLGNLWKFPYMTGVNGGGAFVFVYLLCIAAVGVPIFIAELFVGQSSQKNAVQAFEALDRKKTPWRFIGFLGVLSAFLILSFYSVVGGWVLDFAFKAIFNQFSHYQDEEIRGFLGNLFASPWTQLFWHFVFMTLAVGIVYGGVKDGIEKWNKILMPTLFVLLILLVVRSVFLPGFGSAFHFLFYPTMENLTASGVLEAVGQAFFTMSLGMGAMITYGSYLAKKETKFIKTSFTVALMDTSVALLSGIVIFSVVFTFGLEPGSGPTLMFQTLPILFNKMTGGYFISVAFFILVSFAALTSAVSLLEVVITYWVETHKMKRHRATLVMGGVIFALGVLSALSTNILSEVKVMDLTFFDLFDKLTSSIFLPVGGALISLFFGWVLGEKAIRKVVGKAGPLSDLYCFGLLWSARVIAPLAVFAVLMNSISDF